MIALITLLLVTGYIMAWFYFDRSRKRIAGPCPGLSIIIPCYNDGATVTRTIQSVYHTCRDIPFELLVVNDASKDNSGPVLRQLQQKYGFQLIHNPTNLGKARTLNNSIRQTRHDIVLFLDADVIVNKRSINDLLARFRYNPRLGGVSCPYTPKNRGFLPLMQKIEYVMLALVQGSYNLFSAISLWGGCLAVRKAAFTLAGGFSQNAITEDVDLAYKLNQTGWKVEQSFIPVRTWVPDTLKTWYD